MATGVTASVIAAAWIVVGPTGPVFAWVTHMMLMSWVSVASGLRPAPLTQRWFRVHAWEPAAYRVVGVRLYGRMLDLVRWNAVVTRSRAFDRTRAGLPALDQHTRRSEAAHLLCLLVTVLLAGAIAWTGEWNGVRWLTGSAVPLHVYPVLLQRLVRARIQAVLAPRDGERSR